MAVSASGASSSSAYTNPEKNTVIQIINAMNSEKHFFILEFTTPINSTFPFLINNICEYNIIILSYTYIYILDCTFKVQERNASII